MTHYTGYLQRTCWLSTYVVGFPCGLVLQIKMQEHKTARMAQEQQSLASGALLGQLQFSVAARPASGGYRIMYTNLRLETDL